LKLKLEVFLLRNTAQLYVRPSKDCWKPFSEAGRIPVLAIGSWTFPPRVIEDAALDRIY
jgi:hypothetical protein